MNQMEKLKNFDYTKICQPVLVYALIATIMAFASLFLAIAFNGVGVSLGSFIGHMCAVLCCSLILLAICNYISEKAAWGVLIIILVYNISAIISIISNVMGISLQTLGLQW